MLRWLADWPSPTDPVTRVDLPLSEPARPLPDRRKNPEVQRPSGPRPREEGLFGPAHRGEYKFVPRSDRLRDELEEIAWVCELLGRPLDAGRDWWRGRRLGKP